MLLDTLFTYNYFNFYIIVVPYLKKYLPPVHFLYIYHLQDLPLFYITTYWKQTANS